MENISAGIASFVILLAVIIPILAAIRSKKDSGQYHEDCPHCLGCNTLVVSTKGRTGFHCSSCGYSHEL